MLHLIKMQRCSGDHQYILGVTKDEDIAYFLGEYHQKFERGGHKYYYTVETLTFASEECFIVSWENNDETLRYRVYEHKTFAKIPQGAGRNYRFKAKIYTPLDEYLNDDNIDEASNYWHFFKGKELIGLSKCYEVLREKRAKEWMDKQ